MLRSNFRILAAHCSQVATAARAVAVATPVRLATSTAGRQQFSSIGCASKQSLLPQDSLRHSGLLQWPPPLQQQVSPNAIASPITWQNIFHTAKRTFASKKHKNVLKLTKGFRGRAKNCFSIAVRRLQKSWEYAYRDRRRKKREWRKLWIIRLQAGVRQYQWRYSKFIPALNECNIKLNRKVLSELAANEPFSFRSVVQVVEQFTGKRNGHLIANEQGEAKAA